MAETKTTQPVDTAIATRPTSSLGRIGSPFQPENIEQAFKLAQALSRSPLVPKQLQGQPESVLLVMMKGYELNLPPIAALSEIYVIEGKAVASALLLRSICLSRPDIAQRFEVVESTDKVCRIVVQRVGKDAREHRWTIEQAATAGLLGKDNWKKYPKQMLVARCSTDAARIDFGDLVSGLLNEDEADEIREEMRHQGGQGFVAPPMPASAPATARPAPEDAVLEQAPPPTTPVEKEEAAPAPPPPAQAEEEPDPFADPPPPPPSPGEAPTDEEAVVGWTAEIAKAKTIADLDAIRIALAAAHPEGGVVRKAIGPPYAAKKRELMNDAAPRGKR